MSVIVMSLIEHRRDDRKIVKHQGMDAEEVLRLKHITRFPQAFANHMFPKAGRNSILNIKKNYNRATGHILAYETGSYASRTC